MAATTNSLGKRMLERYAAGTATREQLDAYYAKGWISDADYDAAVNPPAPTEESPSDPAEVGA